MEILEYIEKNIHDFKRDTLNIDRFLNDTRASYSFFQANYPDILKEFNRKERSEEEIEGMEIFKSLQESVCTYESEIYKFCFINLIARTDAFLNDIARSIYLWKKPDLQEEKREKIILRFSHSSFKDKLEHLKKEFNLTFPNIKKWESSIVELFSTRNIILHNNGLVNETYLRINGNSDLNLGDKRVVGEEYLKFTFVLIIIIAKSIEEQIHIKMS
ncbi:hypothetical protein [Fischerella thermalis]|uniref:hypothetical protein n=2 Tax=Fischerella thermalis TaxID=372787 RepID=UPI000C807E96|nr:hypothetical protein [Fischerella thermalis]PLZ05198.1 hypothetical protein CBP19_22355 [Fischerella thermalis WC1110]PLZ38207.1 hypothetical protein CBP26_16080 [Fischerella thermalis WC538]PLZ40482.1 hypothetical protein CBP25_19110 [Fischerella thermalis WC527]PLZ58582.1 hypothetical protein CBP23_21650 [Fischerella thermalis WC344]RDH47825.1 hypothetical protein CA946_18960 [Fischerella thermalis 111/344/542]